MVSFHIRIGFVTVGPGVPAHESFSARSKEPMLLSLRSDLPLVAHKWSQGIHRCQAFYCDDEE